MSDPTRNNRMLRNANTWRQQYDALRWLDIPRAIRLLEQERRGMHAECQYVYDLVDSMDPDMIALIQLRLAAIKRLRWRIACAPDDVAGFDQGLADEQQAALRSLYERMGDIVAATADLAMATFRGYSVLQIRRDAEGNPLGMTALDRWLFARDGLRGDWFWNPSAQPLSGLSLPERDRIGGPELPREDFVIREVPLAVDRVALLCSVRSSTVEKDWDAWCEMYGLHQAILTEPTNAKPEDRAAYDAAARAFSDGQGGTIPAGSSVAFPNSMSVEAPFSARAEYLTRKKVLAGTSGMLTMLAESGSGTLAGGAHQDTFDALAEAEAAEIAELLQGSIDAPFFASRYPGRPVLAWFDLEPYRRNDPGAIADRASNLAPYFDIDADELGEATGLSLKAKPPAPAPMPAGPAQPQSSGAPAAAAAEAATDVAGTALNGAQIASMVEILSTAASGSLPMESVIPIMQAAFPAIPMDVIQRIVGPLVKFTPAAPAALNSKAATPPRDDTQDPQVAALAALAEAQRIGLAPVAARLEAALLSADGPALDEALRAILADLPKLYAAAAKEGAIASTVDVVAQSLADAVGTGYAASVAARAMPPAKESAHG